MLISTGIPRVGFFPWELGGQEKIPAPRNKRPHKKGIPMGIPRKNPPLRENPHHVTQRWNPPHKGLSVRCCYSTSMTCTTCATMTTSVHITVWTSAHGHSAISPVPKFTTHSRERRWTSSTYFYNSALTFQASRMPLEWIFPQCSQWTMTCSCNFLHNRSDQQEPSAITHNKTANITA